MQQAAGGDCEPLQLPPDPLADGGPSQLVISGDLAPEADPDTGHPGADIAAPPPSTDATAHEHAIPRSPEPRPARSTAARTAEARVRPIRDRGAERRGKPRTGRDDVRLE